MTCTILVFNVAVLLSLASAQSVECQWFDFHPCHSEGGRNSPSLLLRLVLSIMPGKLKNQMTLLRQESMLDSSHALYCLICTENYISHDLCDLAIKVSLSSILD